MEKKEVSSEIYKEVYDYITSKGIDLQKDNIIDNVDKGTTIYYRENNILKGLLIYTKSEEDTSKHHVYFLGADTPEIRRLLVKEAYDKGDRPISARRYGKVIKYRNPELLMRRLIYGR